ncbi:ankyrin-3-like [Nilaparvata lugens]|uniref:ankyrin-3-like n=1 Tax=Nilaparvata lugens TaxID=108931 RepID=UPI00193CFE29|nr:ankyrin-3-like [Nilaparvata lugens]
MSFIIHTWRRLNQIIDTAVFPHVTKADIENKLLMELETRTARGDSVLHTAVRLHQFVYMERILECIKYHIDDISPIVNCPNMLNRQTPLHLLIQMNVVTDMLHISVIKALLQVGADPNKTDIFEFNALHLAVKENNVNIVKCLLEFPGININQVSANMGTPLHIAAEENRVEIARLLLKHGADVNSIDLQKGQTPLHVAVKKSHVQIVELLLKQADIDINKEDYRCQTPLKFAILRADTRLLKIVNKLVNRGATFESTNLAEETDDSLESVEENATKTTAKNRKMQTLAFLFSQISVNENIPSEIPFIDTSNIEY